MSCSSPLRCSLYFLALCFAIVAPSASAEPRRLTNDGLVKTSPTFLDRSGDELLYVVEDLPTRMRLMRLRPADGKSEPVHPDETRSEFEPACSPDGRMLSFVQNRGNLNLVLVIREPATKKEVAINVGSGFAGPRSPTFTPDGASVVYSSADEGRQHLFTVGLDGKDPKRTVDSAGVNNWPNVSPDGKQLVFGSSRDSDFELYAAALDGSNARRLTHSPGQDIRPRLSPDGKRVAFTSARDGNYEIYVMNLDGTEVRRLTNHPERDDYAAWHPTGRRLVIVSERSGKHDLYEIDVP
ncbi:MAG: hypothetical protein K8U03_05605 [Planctomycetia bacterium]|nr:hypothetical protein [Planctomycetia bacterium]